MTCNKKAICMALCLVLLSGIMVSCQKNDDMTESDILVWVNDDVILKSQVDLVYEDYKDTNISYDKIVEDSILELLVAQKSSEYGITLSDRELQEIVSDFEKEMPELYQDAIETYGEEELMHKLRIRNLFSRTKQYVIDNIILADGISHDDILKFEQANGLEQQLSPYTDEQIIGNLEKEITEYLFADWMNQLRDNANIQYNST